MPSRSLCGLYVVRAFVVGVDAFPFGLCHFEEAVARIVAERRELRRVLNGERTFLCRWLVVLNFFDAFDANILCVGTNTGNSSALAIHAENSQPHTTDEDSTSSNYRELVSRETALFSEHSALVFQAVVEVSYPPFRAGDHGVVIVDGFIPRLLRCNQDSVTLRMVGLQGVP